MSDEFLSFPSSFIWATATAAYQIEGANQSDGEVTLFHADYPFELYEKGGWLNEECITWYLDYCHLCFSRFGDLTVQWNG
ncbi:hypothetical protein NECAME_00479 [Necator americanus]|uniref:Glycosyl hydrolase, family 1 n=1 Tax=Necator americanus TaxID=51031 RepID=W2T5R6_NECAM|nr:hypothetical protein NECAME_00479 [Necator americanus]ETN76954.1 hypothetical protein NECAME_00479 [Necator americanus]